MPPRKPPKAVLPLAPHGLPGHLVGFVEALREQGISVGPSETVDAGRVMTVLGLQSRSELREGLACAVLRRADHRPTFDVLFDLWFPPALGARFIEVGEEGIDIDDIEQVRDELVDLLASDAGDLPLNSLIARKPFVLLTSNATRELSEALKRRCLFLHIDFPDAELERRILLKRVPELPASLAEELVRIIGVLRNMQLKKVPSVAETIDWGRTILALGLDTLDDAVIASTLGVVLKHHSDQQRAAGELRLN
ncbi:MoxR-like ATPase [Mycobacteroides abscessus subsp. abscessus]|nr:MoxR-like ATPase [Mycobacteroides abscessus subsp. abscessus]